MALIDDDGRLFGRVNLIDAAIVVLVLVLLPIGYAAYVLFRTPAPAITAIEPSEVLAQPNMRVKLRGTGLRPLLKAYIGETPAAAYLYENDESVDVLFSNVAPGRYDLVLFDGVQEVVRVPEGVRIVVPPGSPMSRLVVGGLIVAVDQALAADLQAGQRAGPDHDPELELLEVGPPRRDFRFLTAGEVNVVVPVEGQWQVPVLVRVRCAVGSNGCAIGGERIETRKFLTVPHPKGPLLLYVDYIVPADDPRPAAITVSFVVSPQSLDALRVGQVDASISNVGTAARITSLTAADLRSGETTRVVRESPSTTTERRVADRQAVVSAVVQLDLHESPYGWWYRSQLIKVGQPFTFNGPDYQVTGEVVAIRSLDRALTPP